ncbi:hypothetical protein LTS08_001571 [Lithohypha guttulata]|uniref:RING-type domain-containing protein n=1 Tax=Lithohypha guttulata TaxID=1690604 RepID=A0AAN7SV05_9EURO|nr:hypothetical protein LTR51_003761 [Lithohypha guttulata]KAK5082266.1 hypothetical protein LTR05_007410 [Lithohypha guttulata]KAK5105294.1 hypothetical protein LTS08_001571 [Lithohypha guttulata]
MWRPTSSSRRNPKAESSSRPPLSPRSTLTEVLRLNQLRVKNSSPALTKENAVQDAAISLNEDLAVLAGIYPDVKYDCLRELLSRFDGDSRLEICTEQLYRYKNEWMKGRLQVPPREQDEQIHTEEQFRTQQYRSACSWLLQKEFNSLNKSAIEAVLAEVNNAYGKARPILQEIANKSWRATLQSLFRKKKDTQSLPTFLWIRGRIGQELVPTGDTELDNELEALFVRPLRTELAQSQQEQDFTLAVQLNEWEAQQAEALYECQICYSDTPFENVSACNTEGHIVCLDCVRKSLKEAIFGQNWAQSVEPALSTLKCLAPIDPRCNGHVPAAQLEQAVLLEHSGRELWDRFEERLAEKAIFDSQLPIVRCPFCPYIEADNFFTLETARQHIQWSFQPSSRHRKILAILACEFILPTLLFVYLALRLVWPSLLPTLFYTSLARLASTQRTIRFQCQNPTCKRRSCLKCHKAWHDAHSCDEPLLLSLRQSVEAARTNAVKRVCPRCGTAFVKSSGCNKLTCVCGYSMCYLCRKNIGKTGENEGAEGYRHFCEHFRPVPGTKCTQCDKCDLYKSEEEDVIVRKAGEDAEREWRNKQKQEGKGGNSNEVDNLKINHDLLAERLSIWQKFLRGDWTVQGIADEIVAKVVIVQV